MFYDVVMTMGYNSKFVIHSNCQSEVAFIQEQKYIYQRIGRKLLSYIVVLSPIDYILTCVTYNLRDYMVQYQVLCMESMSKVYS